MALLDFLKRKRARQDVATSGGKQAKPAQKARPIEEGKKPGPDKSAPRILTGKPARLGFSYNIIKEPHISEKGTDLAEKNQYIFRVDPKANKTEIKKSVEGIYGVNVLSAKIIKIPAKKRRLGKTEGYRKGYTKAIVKIAEGQKIEIL